MTHTSSAIHMVKYLRKRLFPLTFGIGLAIALLGPLTYWNIGHHSHQRMAHMYAVDLADELQDLILNSPDLWKYQVYKFMGVSKKFHPEIHVLGFSILDERGLPIEGYEQGTVGDRKGVDSFLDECRYTLGSAPILFNGRLVGFVLVRVSDADILRVSALLLALSSLVGVGLALLVYWFPVTVTQKMETEIIKLVEDVEQSGEKYRALVANIPDVIWTADSSGNTRFISQNVTEVTGILPDEAHRNGALLWGDRVHEDNRDEVRTAYEELFTKGRRFDREYRIMAADGSWLWIRNRAAAPYFENGQAYADGIITDITERKSIEDNVSRLNRELQVLYQISTATNRTIDMQQLFASILNTMTETLALPYRNAGAIFLNEGTRLCLSSAHSPADWTGRHCQEVKLGECLCGQAAVSGDVMFSYDPSGVGHHDSCAPGRPPHGHLIIPLKADNKVIGVIKLSTAPGFTVNKQMNNFFATIGNQLGIAVNNSLLYEETRAFSLHDPLTGLGNRRFLEIQLRKSLETAKRYKEVVAVIMADIDHFKQYNDRYGHPEGDQLLRQVSAILVREMRDADYVFRYGGEEFLLLPYHADGAAAHALAERLRAAVAKETTVTISLGVVSFPDGNITGENLIRLADEALYRAKQNGRNRVETVLCPPYEVFPALQARSSA